MKSLDEVLAKENPEVVANARAKAELIKAELIHVDGSTTLLPDEIPAQLSQGFMDTSKSYGLYQVGEFDLEAGMVVSIDASNKLVPAYVLANAPANYGNPRIKENGPHVLGRMAGPRSTSDVPDTVTLDDLAAFAEDMYVMIGAIVHKFGARAVEISPRELEKFRQTKALSYTHLEGGTNRYTVKKKPKGELQ